MKWFHISAVMGVSLLCIGHGLGLFVAPPEAMMGDVGRILYVHVPTAWVALVVYLISFGAAVGSLWFGRLTWDATVRASVEVGVVLTALLVFQGSVWARPTWGVWWAWDPRLTTTAIMMITYVAILIMRNAIQDSPRRLVITAVATIVAFVDVPIVYFSVKWWKSLHQDHSSPDTVSDPMILPLRLAAIGMLLLALGLIGARRKTELDRLNQEVDPASLPEPIEALSVPGESE